jgi:hypothetical protein
MIDRRSMILQVLRAIFLVFAVLLARSWSLNRARAGGAPAVVPVFDEVWDAGTTSDGGGPHRP